MKLTRINKIRDYRIFQNFSWPNDHLPFGTLNLIYGCNWSGKTRLASLLLHLEDNSAISEGQIGLEFDETNRVEGKNLPTATVPQVRVFNRDFIESIILPSGTKMAPIYYFGKDSAEKQRQVEVLREQYNEATTEVTERESENKDAEKNLDDFCIEKAKDIKEFLISSHTQRYSNYDKRNFKLAIEGFTDESRNDALLTNENKEKLRKQKDTQPKSKIAKVIVQIPDFAAIAARAETLLNRSVVSQLIDELKMDLEVSDWVQRGLSLHSGERKTDTCRFCGNPLTVERRNLLQAHFNDEFTTFQSTISDELKSLRRYRDDLIDINFPDSSRLYDHLATEYEQRVAEARVSIAEGVSFLDVIYEALQCKMAAPFKAGSKVGGTGTIPDHDALEGAIKSVNKIIEKHNVTTREFQDRVNQACETLERFYVSEAFPDYKEKKAALEQEEAILRAASEKAKRLKEQIAIIERDIIENRRPAEELNMELRAYLGHGEIRFDVMESGYTLKRAGLNAVHLSEGEKSAIAFLYFLKSLQDKAFDLKGGVVVIDDPVSSLDSNTLFSAFGYMKERVKDAGQIFILTHNFAFFRQVRNWFFHHNEIKKNRKLRPGRYYMLRTYVRDGQRSASLTPIDPLLEKYESEYHYLFKTVYKEVQRGDSDVGFEYYYGMPNIARRLLEAFLAFRYPDVQGTLWKRVEQVDFNPERKVRILRLLNTYSHSESIEEPEHDPTVLIETRAILCDLLALIKHEDSAHYQAMKRLVSALEDTE